MNPVQDYITDLNKDIGGAIVPVIGGQGAGKSLALIKIGLNHLEENSTVIWRGTKEAQWQHFLANDEHVTVWNHETIEDHQLYVQGSKTLGKPRENIENLHDKNVDVREWSDPVKLIDNLDMNGVNVINIPGNRGEEHELYFFRRTWLDVIEAMIGFNYGDFFTFLSDEVGDLFPSQQQLRKPHSRIINGLPQKLAQFRKQNIIMYAAGHGTQDMHYFLWKIKANSIAYMQGAKVKNNLSPLIDQQKINGLSKGDLVMPGPDVAEVVKPKESFEVLDWVPESHTRNLRSSWSYTTPNLLEQKDENSFELDDLLCFLKDETEWSTRTIAEMVNKTESFDSEDEISHMKVQRA